MTRKRKFRYYRDTDQVSISCGWMRDASQRKLSSKGSADFGPVVGVTGSRGGVFWGRKGMGVV